MSRRNWRELFKRAGQETLEDHLTLLAKALAFSTFMAIPSVLLVGVGVLSLAVSAHTIDTLVSHLHTFVPGQARQLLASSLHRLETKHSASLLISIGGFLLAVWSVTSAMSNYMTALDMAYDRRDRRSWLKRRLVALEMAGCLAVMVIVLVAFLIFGAKLEHTIGRAISASGTVNAIWSVLIWPILVLGLLIGFAALLYLGPDVKQRRFRLATPGAFVAAVAWVITTGGLSLYASNFGSYNKTWGSLAAVIVALMWLWLSSLALLFGAELDSEIDASAATARPSA